MMMTRPPFFFEKKRGHEFLQLPWTIFFVIPLIVNQNLMTPRVAMLQTIHDM